MGEEVVGPARGREARKLAAGVAVLWAVIGVAAALTVSTFGTFGGTSDIRMAVAVCGLVAGMLNGVALYRFAQSTGRVTGLLLGHLAALPPALRLGLEAADAAARQTGLHWPSGALPAYCVALCAVAVAAALVGSRAGAKVAQGLAYVAHVLFSALRIKPPLFRWRAARLTVLLALLGAALFHAGQKTGYLPPADDVPGASAWIEREKRIFSDAVAAHAVDAIVLPVQAAGATFDRAERSLMTRYLARRVERSGLKVADPTLLARALDARSRRTDQAQAQALAERTGARILVESQVSRKADRLDFESVLWRRTESGTWQRAAAASLQDLPWSDASAASVAVLNSVDGLATQLGLGAARVPADEPTIGAPSLARLSAFVEGAHGSAERRAVALQLLGALHRRESLEGDALWERSLVAAADAPRGSARKLVEARAYLHLSRRPAALAVLGEPQSDEERFLFAMLNGDVPGAERTIVAITDPVKRLIAEIELADLYYAFGFETRIVHQRAATIANLQGTAAAAAGFRMSYPDWFNTEVHQFVAAELPSATPLGDFLREAAEAAYPWVAWLYWRGDPIAQREMKLPRQIEQGKGALWRQKRMDWAAAPAADRPASWDYFDLLYSLNERAMLKSVQSTLYLQGLFEKALRLCEALQRGPFEDHPWITLFHASALDRAGRQLDPFQAQPMFTRSSALAAAVYRWEGGESHLSWPAEHLTFGRKYDKYTDEPIRWYRSRNIAGDRESFERLRFSRREMEGFVAEDRRRLAYSDRQAAPLKDLVGWLRRSGQAESAAAELDANRHRFVGAALTAELLAEAEDMRRTGDARPYFRKLLEIDPESWNARWRLAAMHLEAGAPAEAQALFLAYPPFKDASGRPDRVRLSNIAFEAGNFLHRSGEPQLALALFELSAGMQTGSNRWMQSREALALASNDLGGAMNFARMQIQRYQNPKAGMRLVAYQSLLGRTRDADALLADFLNRFDDEATWTAAFLAHRMGGMDSAAAEAWLARAAHATGRKTYFDGALRERHALMLALLDRRPDAAAVAHVERVARANNGSPFYTSLAQAYVAMHAGQFAAAADKFRRPFEDLLSISASRGTPLADVLPYLAYSLSRAGNAAHAEQLLTDYRGLLGIDADYLIARALLDGRAGSHEAAEASLRRAFFRLPDLGTRTFFSGYVLLEAAELLLKETGEPRYRGLIAQLAGRLQLSFPYPWAAAFEAQYAEDAQVREAAVAATEILDPASPRLASLPRLDATAARTAAARNPGLLGSVVRAHGR